MPRAADPRAKIALLRAAEEVFAERGFHGAKVEDIAKRAGISKGAFYLHFEGKEAALEHIVESFLARCASYFARPSDCPDLPDDADDLLEYWLQRDRAMYELLWRNRAVLRILETCQGAYDHLVQAFRHDVESRTREWVDWRRRVGLFRADLDAELCSTLIVGGYDEITQRMLRVEGDRRPPLEAWVRFAQETFARAYGTPELIQAVERRASADVRRPLSARASLRSTLV